MDFEKETKQIAQRIRAMQKKGLKLFTSSSFQSHSIPLLHILSRIDKSIPVYFLNTGFHFPETLAYKHEIGSLLGIRITDLQPDIEKIFQKDSMGRFFYASDTNFCCHINKVQPMEAVLKSHDVWIAGVRADQNLNRQGFSEFAEGKHGTMRYHPMLAWSARDIYEYRAAYNLPEHPLESQGYLSVGCQPCTSKFMEDVGRSGRWHGTKKDECGLHLELAKQ